MSATLLVPEPGTRRAQRTVNAPSVAFAPGSHRAALVFAAALAHDRWARLRTLRDGKPRGRWVGGVSAASSGW